MGDEIINVAPMDAGKQNSEVAEKLSGEKTVILGQDSLKCYWNDAEFEEGNTVCDGGVPYKCHMGMWIKQDGEC